LKRPWCSIAIRGVEAEAIPKVELFSKCFNRLVHIFLCQLVPVISFQGLVVAFIRTEIGKLNPPFSNEYIDSNNKYTIGNDIDRRRELKH